ncbi:MAG: hypothetical protein F6K17_29080 [Okeania sp. SIO3C4]|nr:hypothetical protein [Okeania sp. SIO3C4]
MLVHFRERIGTELINEINSDMVKTQAKNQKDEGEKKHKIRRNQEW